MGSERLIAIGRAAAACMLLLAAPLFAQDTSTRRIDPDPKILLRPPPALPQAHRPGSGIEQVDATTRSDRDHRLGLELELKERREQMHDDPGAGSHYVAAIACVVGSGVVLVSFLLWASKRRGR